MDLKIRHTLIVLCCLLLAMGCTSTPETENAPPAPTETPTPTATPTIAPTATLTPSSTPTLETEEAPAEPVDDVEATATPTPTLAPLGADDPPDAPPSICEGLTGALEAQMLVGPAEAVGLEPFAVGSIPFAVLGDAAPYTVEGQAPIDYQDILVENWGTYEVTMDLVETIRGTCVEQGDAGVLNLIVNMVGEQLVVVKAEGFNGSYPWAGEQDLIVTLPIEEGATVMGEGWAYVLHLLGNE